MGPPSPPVTLTFDATPRPWKALARALLRRWSDELPLQNLPPFTAHWSGARAQPAALRSYLELCEDHNPAAGVCVPPAPAPYYSFALPPLFIHAMAMPLHLSLLTHPRFSLPLLGLVHLANRTEMLDTVAPGEALDFACTLDGIAASAKGPTFTLHSEARVQGRVVWREQSSYLYPQRSDPPRHAPSAQPAPAGAPIAEWDVAADAGRRFAVPVRDFNPIHLSDWSARLLGQRSAIAHGLYSAARCLDVLRQHHPMATPFVLDVQFKRPLPLPARVALHAVPEKKGQRFALQIQVSDSTDSAQTHLVGTLMPLRSAR